MEGELTDIALRLKEMRVALEISVEHAANTCGLSVDEYILFEDGTKDIPVGLLHRMSKHYGFDLALLLTGEQPQVKTFTLTRKGKGVVVKRRSEYNYESLAPNFINKKSEPFLVIVEPKEDPAPVFNSHAGQEFNYLLEGQLKFCFGEQEMILNPGDSVYFDSSTPHSMVAMNGRAAKFIAVIL